MGIELFVDVELLTFVVLALVYPFVVACDRRPLTQAQYGNNLFWIACLCGVGSYAWGHLHHCDLVPIMVGYVWGCTFGLFVSGLIGLRIASN